MSDAFLSHEIERLLEFLGRFRADFRLVESPTDEIVDDDRSVRHIWEVFLIWLEGFDKTLIFVEFDIVAV